MSEPTNNWIVIRAKDYDNGPWERYSDIQEPWTIEKFSPDDPMCANASPSEHRMAQKIEAHFEADTDPDKANYFYEMVGDTYFNEFKHPYV